MMIMTIIWTTIHDHVFIPYQNVEQIQDQQMYVCMHLCMYACRFMFSHNSAREIHSFFFTKACIYVLISAIYIYIYAYIYIYIHKYMYIYIHVYIFYIIYIYIYIISQPNLSLVIIFFCIFSFLCKLSVSFLCRACRAFFVVLIFKDFFES